MEFLANAPPLTSLALNWIKRGLELTPLWSVPSLRHLEALALGSGDAEAQLDAIGAWPDLRRLRLLGRYLLPNEFAARLGGMQRLEHLAIRNGPSLSVPELATILRRPLRSLELGGAAALTDDAFDALSRCSSLDRLTLDLVHDPQLTGRMTDQGLERLTLPALRTLHLRCPGGRGEGLRPEALPELRRLRLAVAGRRAAEQVGQLPHLRHLDMSAGALTADMVEPLAASTTLCSLRASVGPTMAEALGELLARSSITELELTATTFTPDLVRALSRGARLRRLALLRPGIPGGDTPIDVSHLEALLELQDLAITGQAVVPGSWSSLARLASLRVVRHECSDGSVLPTIRAALPGVHVVGRVPQPRSRDLRA